MLANLGRLSNVTLQINCPHSSCFVEEVFLILHCCPCMQWQYGQYAVFWCYQRTMTILQGIWSGGSGWDWMTVEDPILPTHRYPPLP